MGVLMQHSLYAMSLAVPPNIHCRLPLKFGVAVHVSDGALLTFCKSEICKARLCLCPCMIQQPVLNAVNLV